MSSLCHLTEGPITSTLGGDPRGGVGMRAGKRPVLMDKSTPGQLAAKCPVSACQSTAAKRRRWSRRPKWIRLPHRRVASLWLQMLQKTMASMACWSNHGQRSRRFATIGQPLKEDVNKQSGRTNYDELWKYYGYTMDIWWYMVIINGYW